MYICTYMYVQMDVCQISSTSEGNLRSQMRTQWPIFVKLGIWVVGGTSTTHVVCHHQMRIFETSFAYLLWLANYKKVKYPENSVWATLMKLGLWVVIDTSK